MPKHTNHDIHYSMQCCYVVLKIQGSLKVVVRYSNPLHFLSNCVFAHRKLVFMPSPGFVNGKQTMWLGPIPDNQHLASGARKGGMYFDWLLSSTINNQSAKSWTLPSKDTGFRCVTGRWSWVRGLRL